MLRAKDPLRAPDSQDKASAWLITIKKPIGVGRVTPQGRTFAPSTNLNDKNRESRSRLKTSRAASITAVQHVSHVVMICSFSVVAFWNLRAEDHP